MDILEVDERDTQWEDFDPVFRVFAITPAAVHMVYDVRNAVLNEIVAWVSELESQGNTCWIAVRGESEGRPGLIWLNPPPEE